MVIYANQTLRTAYTAMEKLLKEMVTGRKNFRCQARNIKI